MTPILKQSIDKGVATVVFNRPRVKNAMSQEMRAAFHEALLELKANDDVFVIVLQGAGGNFIAGGDVASFAETLELPSSDRVVNFTNRVNASSDFITCLATFPKPVISLVEGDVAGAGIGIALASDFILAHPASRFSFSHAQIGLALDIGLSYFLPRLIGPLQAKRLSMTGARLSGIEALNLGLVTSLTDNLDEDLDALITGLSKMSPHALKAIKEELNQSIDSSFSAQLELEARKVGECAGTDEFYQRVSAFMKRTKAS